MKSIKVCVLALSCVGGAFAFGVVANAAIDYVMKPQENAAEASAKAAFAKMAPATEPAEPAPGRWFRLGFRNLDPGRSWPRQGQDHSDDVYRGAGGDCRCCRPCSGTASSGRRSVAAPASRDGAPTGVHTGSIARQPGTMAIAAATKQPAEDTEILSDGQINRMRTALALTAEQEEFWPAIATELRAIGKQFPRQKGRKPNQPLNITVDADTKQRLYWAAAPLITRLSYEQKLKAKQMARMMGLNEVAEAL